MKVIAPAHRHIEDRLAELRGARIIAEHNPTPDNLNTVRVCEEALDQAIAESKKNN